MTTDLWQFASFAGRTVSAYDRRGMHVKLTDLRGILQYIPQFREKTFILAIDGAIVTDDNFATLMLDVALLWSLNIRVVLVHGASAQIKVARRRAQRQGLGSRRRRRHRCRHARSGARRPPTG